MKKIVLGLVSLSALAFAACSSGEKTAKPVDSTSKQTNQISYKNQTTHTTTRDKKAPSAAVKAEKEKQALITQKVIVADTKMKMAETNPTNETYAAAKTAFEAIPGGNEPLQKRLEAVASNLDAIKQQADTSTFQQSQEQPVQSIIITPENPNYYSPNQQSGESDWDYAVRSGAITAEYDKRDDLLNPVWKKAGYTSETEYQQAQQNLQNGVDPNGNELLPGQDHAAGSNSDGTPDDWVQGQIDWAKENGYVNEDGSLTEKGQPTSAGSDMDAIQ